MEEKNLRQKTISNLIWKFMERILAQGVSTVVSIILARLLMPEDYGLVTTVMIIINICNVFVSEGFASALIQKTDADEKDFSSMFFASFICSILIYGVIFFCAPFISGFFGSEYELLTPILRVLCLQIPISSVKAIQQAYVSRKLMFKKFFWATLFGTIFSAGVGIFMAYYGFGAWALVGQYLVNTIIDTGVLWFSVQWRPIPYFSIKRVKSMMEFGSKLLVAGLIDTVYNELRSIIIGKKYSSSDLAFYGKGKQFPQLIINNINASFMAVLYPVMSKLQDDTDRLREVCRKSIKLSTYVIFPCLIGLAAISDVFITVLLSDKWIEAVPYVKIFCCIYSFYPIYTANLQAIKAIGRSDIYLVTEISKKVSGIICLLISIPFGVYWIAMSLLFATLLNYLINGISAKIVLKYKFTQQVRDIVPNFFLVVFMVIFIKVVPCNVRSDIAKLVIQCLEGVIIYVLLSVVTRNESFGYLLSIIREKSRKI